MTFKYNNVYVNCCATVAGPFEKKGPLSNKFDKTYEVSLCCGSGLIQYINITPMVNMEEGSSNGN